MTVNVGNVTVQKQFFYICTKKSYIGTFFRTFVCVCVCVYILGMGILSKCNIR